MQPWLTLSEGLKRPGLRLVLVRAGVPSPWSEFCRAVFHVKGIDYEQVDGRDPATGVALLKQVSGQESMPVALWNEERPRSNWLEILHLAETLREEPRLLPDPPEASARVIGLCAELCREGGFGWNRRLLLTHHLLTHSQWQERERRIGHYLAKKYGYDANRLQQSSQRCEDVVAVFARLHTAQEANDTYFNGRSLSALDLAWAAFAALIRPMAQEFCPMSDMWRTLYTWEPARTSPELVSALLQRRDRVYTQHLALPVIVA
jgi:glutathione S-transferase